MNTANHAQQHTGADANTAGFLTVSSDGVVVGLDAAAAQMMSLCNLAVPPVGTAIYDVADESGSTEWTQLLEALRQGNPARAELHHDGVFFDFSLGAVPGTPYHLIKISRLRESSSQSAELEEKNRLLERIARTFPGIISIYNLEMKSHEYTSRRSLMELVGYSQEQISEYFGATAKQVQLVHPDDLARVQGQFDILYKMRESDVDTLVYRLRAADGGWQWIQRLSTPFSYTDDGKPVRMLHIFSNVTAQKEAELELFALNASLEATVRERTKELARQNRRMAELLQEKNEILGIVSHDLKKPISSILLSVSTLRAYGMRPDEFGDDIRLSQIEGSAQHAQTIIGDVLDAARLEESVGVYRPTLCAVDRVVRQAVLASQPSAQQKGIQISVSDNSGIPAIHTDPVFVAHIADNLLSNAIKYSPPGSTILVNIAANPADESVVFSVTDQGPGIPEEDIPRLFLKFSRGAPQPTGGEASSGLGLWIVRRLIETLRGEIHCKSVLGAGTTFEVVLPYRVLSDSLEATA